MSRRSRRGFAEGFARRNEPKGIGRQIRNAMTPVTQGTNTKTLADMSPEERAALERQYGAKIKEPKK